MNTKIIMSGKYVKYNWGKRKLRVLTVDNNVKMWNAIKYVGGVRRLLKATLLVGGV